MRKQKKYKIHTFWSKKPHLIALFAFVLFSSVGWFFISRQLQPVIETPRSEMKTFAPNLKEVLGHTTKVAKTSATFRVPILLYHYVEYIQDKKDTIRQSLDVNPATFDQQIQTLVNANFTFMTAKELGEVIDGKMQLPKNPILITFDDGHWDLDTVVLPILKKYHIKATAYIISGFLGGSDFLSNNQLQDVIHSGLIDVGAHTVHHILLKGKLDPIVRYEVSQSKIMLENTFHIHVVSFAYPNGGFDAQAIEDIKNAGFTTAVSTIPGIDQNNTNRFYLYRLRPGYRTGAQLLSYLQQKIFLAY